MSCYFLQISIQTWPLVPGLGLGFSLTQHRAVQSSSHVWPKESEGKRQVQVEAEKSNKSAKLGWLLHTAYISEQK